jgi:hypothetical protein
MSITNRVILHTIVTNWITLIIRILPELLYQDLGINMAVFLPESKFETEIFGELK